MLNREQLEMLKQRFLISVERFNKTPLMTILFATTTSLMLYQNCSPTAQSTSAASTKTGVYSSTIGGYSGTTGSTGSAGGASPSTTTPGGAVMVPGGGTGSGGTGTGGTGTGGTGTGGTGGAMPTSPSTPGSGGTVGGGGTGGTGVSPGGSTGGASTNLVWQYQPEDRTAEEGDVLTLSSYATKGIDVVTYQWYKNGQMLPGQTGYMYRALLIPLSTAGSYYVVAKSGTETIQSVTVTVKVKPARNACPPGNYGVYPGTNNYDEYWHESMIGKMNAPYALSKELADGYTVKMPYTPSAYNNTAVCLAANGIFQCRNGKLVSTEQVTCTQYRDVGGG